MGAILRISKSERLEQIEEEKKNPPSFIERPGRLLDRAFLGIRTWKGNHPIQVCAKEFDSDERELVIAELKKLEWNARVESLRQDSTSWEDTLIIS